MNNTGHTPGTSPTDAAKFHRAKARHAHDSFVRWQMVRIKQLGNTANVVFAVTNAAIAFGVKLLVDEKAPGPPCLKGIFLVSLLFLLSSSGLYLWLNCSRLLDFRYTAKAARSSELMARLGLGETLDSKDKEEAGNHDEYKGKYEKYGKWTWCLLRFQFSTFFIGILIFAISPCA